MGETILIVEDAPHLRQFIEVNLRLEGYAVLSAADGETALEMVTARPPDLVVLDVGLPGMDGLAVCRRLRADTRTAHLPVIFLTGRTEAIDRIAGLAAGADDYVVKPFDPMELVARIRTTLERTADLRGSSPLTGLPGNQRLDHELARRFGLGDPLALAYLDLNHFKAYNDAYGFLAGDEVITLLATTALDVVDRTTADGFLGHIGGDDFLALCHPDEVDVVCQEVIAGFDARIGDRYPPDDRARGWVELEDRQGTLRRFPLVSLAVGVSTNRWRRFADHRELVAVAVEMKAFAKRRSEGSSYAVDDRRDPAGEAADAIPADAPGGLARAGAGSAG